MRTTRTPARDLGSGPLTIDLVSEHANPLAAIGGVDAGGQNVHVAALAAGLARTGHRLTVHTRRDDAGLPERVTTPDGYTVAHVTAGPPVPLPKDDLLGHMPAFAAAPVDVFGMGLAGLHERYGLDPDRVALHDDPPQAAMHAELARRRGYVHPVRWSSLGLSLLEAMHLGMPVVGLASTEAVEAVPAEAGVLSTRPERLWEAVRHFVDDEGAARLAGKAARAAALERYGLDRFLADWDRLLGEVTR